MAEDGVAPKPKVGDGGGKRKAVSMGASSEVEGDYLQSPQKKLKAVTPVIKEEAKDSKEMNEEGKVGED